MTLNPARLARFADWAKTRSPRPLPRTVTPVPSEYYIGYIARLAAASHLEFGELTGALDDPASILYHPTAGGSTSRNAWRPPQASRWRGSPGSTGPTPATTCVTPKGSGGCCA